MTARLASGNPHKLVELRRALPGWEIELVDDSDFPPETGTTYEENARGKALHGRRSAPADAWVIGEDSGIEASGLGGRPGIASARWATTASRSCSWSSRRSRIAARATSASSSRSGRPARRSWQRARSRARSRRERRGAEGFGYDPIFVPEGETSTVAELGDDWKTANSHRARAAAALAADLETRGERLKPRPRANW